MYLKYHIDYTIDGCSTYNMYLLPLWLWYSYVMPNDKCINFTNLNNLHKERMFAIAKGCQNGVNDKMIKLSNEFFLNLLNNK